MTASNSFLWFGRYKNTHIKDIPNAYLEWLIDNKSFKWVGRDKEYIYKTQNQINKKIGRPFSVFTEDIKTKKMTDTQHRVFIEKFKPLVLTPDWF